MLIGFVGGDVVSESEPLPDESDVLGEERISEGGDQFMWSSTGESRTSREEDR